MKKYRMLLFLTVVLLTGSNVSAQTKIVKYCEIDPNGGFTPGKFSLVEGKSDTLFSFKDSNVVNNLRKISTLRTFPDLLNYMSALGWKFIPYYYRGYIFKKEFSPEELK